MSQNTDKSSQAERIAQLVEEMSIYAGLPFTEVCERWSKRLRAPYDMDRFNRLFRAKDKAKSANKYYEIDELTALVQVFIEDVAPELRCKASQAFQLFNFAHVPLEAFKRLKRFFPEAEYRAAWRAYTGIDEESSDAPKDPNLLRPVYPQVFIGRDADLAAIHSRLGVNETGMHAPLTVIRGWPGVGKTTLINRLVYDESRALRALYPDGILWTSLGPSGNGLQSLRSWARQLNAIHVEQLRSVEEVIEAVRHILQNKQVLLVIDDVWNEEQGNVFKKLASDQTTFLFTTRFTDVALILGEHRENVHLLDVLSPQASLELMALFAPYASQAYPAEMESLVTTLEGLPLALRVSGRLVEDEYFMGFDPTPLITELQTNFRSFQDKAPAERFDEATGQTPTIGLLFRRSIQTLAPADQQAFACVGGFAHKPATFDLKAMGVICGLVDPKRTARVLVGRGLLEPRGDGRFQMHYTLSMYARHLLDTHLAELDDPQQ
ncbi:MAG: ATP-binding protein [Anaerolineae bacterium]